MLSTYRQRPRFVLVLICVPIIIISLSLLHSHAGINSWAPGRTSGNTGSSSTTDDASPRPPDTWDDNEWDPSDDIDGPLDHGQANGRSANYAYNYDGHKSPGGVAASALRAPYSSGSAAAAAGAIPAAGIEKYMLHTLAAQWSRFDDARHFAEYGLKVGNVTLDGYARVLERMHRKFFSRSPDEPEFAWMADVRRRMALRPPREPYPPRPNQLVTTDKDPHHLPKMFGDWKKKMPDINLVAFNDRALEDWVDKTFGGTQLYAIWRRLPRIVLKSDIFRYLVMLAEGGIYADSDTAPLIPASRWGIPYEVRTPAALRSMSDLLSLADVDAADADIDVWAHPPVDDGNEHGAPGLIIGVEFDAIMYGWDWREIGVSRAVQLTQWVMAARPGHPIFLDVVGRALEKTLKIERDEAEAKAKGEPYHEEWALEWTGPGVWTDCVYRYLMARYGFLPEDLYQTTRPIRVGDVLILPSKTFAANWPDENGNFGREFDAVVHGFHGRWRGDDPGVQEINRLKEEAKEKEEAEKKEHEGEGAGQAPAEGQAEGQAEAPAEGQQRRSVAEFKDEA